MGMPAMTQGLRGMKEAVTVCSGGTMVKVEASPEPTSSVMARWQRSRMTDSVR